MWVLFKGVAETCKGLELSKGHQMENEMATKGFNGAIWSLRLTC